MQTIKENLINWISSTKIFCSLKDIVKKKSSCRLGEKILSFISYKELKYSFIPVCIMATLSSVQEGLYIIKGENK